MYMGTPYIPELAELLRRSVEKFGHRLSTTTDYELLSLVIEQETGELISSSTLKRLWGYVRYASTPRIATLDVLSRYVGYHDFKAFCEDMKASGVIVSSFFTSKVVCSSDLEPGTGLLVGWAPNRMLKLRYKGENTYVVEDSHNAKLCAGDEFTVSEFILGAPLYLATVRRDGATTPPYVGGKANGLNMLEVLSDKAE